MLSRITNSGLILALCGFAGLSVGDAIIKSMAGHWPGTAIAALRYTIGAAGLGLLLWKVEGRQAFHIPMPKAQLLRGSMVALATVCFFSAIFLMPLAEATAIQFSSPMITALLSALFLGERATKATWLASIIAFAGVIVILRPNVELLGWAAFLPLIAAFGMAGVMIGNRQVASAGSALQMQFLIAVIAAVFLIVAAIAGHFSGFEPLAVSWPDWTVVARCALVAVTASFSHSLVYMGTTKASAAQVAPMVYVQIVMAMALGILFFGNWPDITALGGAGIIIAAGIYLWRSKRVGRG
ncbi:DMT family transporter [Sphingorhabdus arenilitoris]|uniref:DMT family transporter n=1 Tax=Sphingorhabdus arenilitoris TaxID=1490041 RepID=A0ABV8RE22_9SPHN